MEFLKLSPPEQTYIKKNILYTQMEILNIIKRYQKYQQLRKLELKIKMALKKKIKETREEIALLDQALPKTKYQTTEKINKAYNKKRQTLENEIDEIREKLKSLG